jgi:Protoheme ferro-lyase (ferrochelatase)
LVVDPQRHHSADSFLQIRCQVRLGLDRARLALQTGTADLTQAVAAEMARLGHHVQVRYAMRYGNPSVASVLDEMAKQNVTRILLVPLYPQYCAATTASTLDAVTAWMRRSRRMPELRVLNHFHDEPLYIEALARKIEPTGCSRGGRTNS